VDLHGETLSNFSLLDNKQKKLLKERSTKKTLKGIKKKTAQKKKKRQLSLK
jgi:hypothetical protein